MADVGLESINVIAELERIGWDFDATGADELKCRCPAHEDKTASASISVDKRLWKCHAAGCGAKGDFITFLAAALKSDRKTVMIDLLTRYEFKEIKTIDPLRIETYHLRIWNHPIFLKAMYDRGLTDDTIRKFRIGEHKNRITIPVWNDTGLCVNIRSYLPGAPGATKMINERAHGNARLYPIAQLSYDTIVVCGGEMKALVVAQEMNKHGVGAITATAGEGNWTPAFTERLRGKRIFVCMDIDVGGKKASNKVCAMIRAAVTFVGQIDLPLDVDAYPHGDINDYFGLEKRTPEEFMELLDAIAAWQPKTVSEDVDGPARVLRLAESTQAKYAGQRIAVKGIIAAMDTTPYLIPRKVRCSCTRDQENCSECPVFARTADDNGFVELTLHCESPAILDMVAESKKGQKDALREGLRIPFCKVIEFTTLTHYNVEDIRLSPQLEIASQHNDSVMLPALSISHGLEMNVTYGFEGRTYPHPKTQQATLLVSSSKPTQDSLSSHKPTDEELDELACFQPVDWTVDALRSKLNSVYSDLEANVTRIYKRRKLHLAIDLAYHSCLFFRFDKRIVKGWVEVLVVGDSSQGKTETSSSLMKHYGLGEKVECKNATVAGLLGGLQQIGGRWFVAWGIIPTHDRRLVILEELKGASQEVISKLTDMRSSGVAEIPKIEKRRTHARTRLIALSNPRSDQPISAYNYGVDAIKELIGSPEDIRRFDFILIVASSQIKASDLNKLARHRPEVKETYTSDLCHRLILWIWTRSVDQVEITEDATELILDKATLLCERFSDVIPIVDRGSMRLKLARLSSAIAARCFSTGPSKQILVVRPCHVEFIYDLLDSTYGDAVFGYADFSEAYNRTRRILKPEDVKKRIFATPFPRDFIEQMLYVDDLELRDISDWCGWDRGEAIELLSFLVRKHAIQRVGRQYRKTADFIELLKELQDSDDLKIVDRPEHIQEDF